MGRAESAFGAVPPACRPALLVALAGCGAPTVPGPIPATVTIPVADDAATPPAPSTPASDASAAPAPTTVHVRLQIDPTGSDGARNLLVVADEIALQMPLFALTPADRCVAEARPSRRGRGDSPPALFVACGTRVQATITVDEGKLAISRHGGGPSAEVPWPPGASAVYDATLADAPAVCPAGAPAVAFEVKVTRDGSLVPAQQPEPKDRHLLIRGPDFTLSEWLGQKVYCHARRYRSGKRWEMSCGLNESSFAFIATVHDGAIYFRARSHVMAGPSGEVPLGGVALPCGAQVKFPAVHLVDPGWLQQAFGGADCAMAYDLCSDPCWATMTDDDGELTEAGQRCDERCSMPRNRCVARGL